MQMKRDTLKPIQSLKRIEFDRASLQLRLTAGITTIALLGVGSIGTWTTWQMRKMLLGDHKQEISNAANHIEQQLMDVDTTTPSASQWQTTIDQWASSNLWVAITADGTTLTRSAGDLVDFSEEMAAVPWAEMPTTPTVKAMNGHYMILHREPLQRGQQFVGELYLARDITHDYRVLSTLVNTLRFGTLLALGMIGTLIAMYIQRSLRPLRQINQMATVQVGTRLSLPTQTMPDNCPSEMQGFVQAMSTLSTRLFETGERQREFTNGLSHELRTSLCLIQGYLKSTLRRGDNLTVAQREALEIAESEAERTVQLLKDLLDLGRMNSSAVEFDLKPIVLNDAIDSAIEMIDPQGERLIKVEAALPVVAQADQEHLNRVLLHLLKNAKQYSKPDQPIQCQLCQTSDWAIIQISDRGCGIPAADQPHIFEPFYRVEASRCRSTGGMGLGLAIVKSLVESMAGEVTVDSTPGLGSRFTVKLPIGETQPEEI